MGLLYSQPNLTGEAMQVEEAMQAEVGYQAEIGNSTEVVLSKNVSITNSRLARVGVFHCMLELAFLVERMSQR